MLESAELGHTISAAKFDAAELKLRTGLLQAQLALRAQPFPVVVIVAGAEGTGKGDLVHRFNDWLDPRTVETHAFGTPTDETRERPPYWQFWRAMPPRGRLGIFFGSWYTRPIEQRAYGRLRRAELDTALDRIVAFEEMLAADGVVFVKLWLHLPKREQAKRLKCLRQEGRLGPGEWKHFRHRREFMAAAERTLRRTDSPAAPWHVVEATDHRYRDLTAGTHLVNALQQALATARPAARPARRARRETPPIAAEDSVLSHVDLTQRLAKAEYREQLGALQERLGKLGWKAHRRGVSTVLAFEGWDAAGKGSAIRRVTHVLDPRLYRVVSISAPSDEERAHHYLWRFWRQLPGAGLMTVFDRSWYGRVLVERVEGFATTAEWTRAYREINAFEEQLVEHGVVVAKFWLHISPEEQLRRFEERQRVPYKRYKITPDDWRNRAKWPAYQRAVDDLVEHCSTEYAPWTLVSGNDKRHARIQVLSTIADRLEAAL